MSGFDRGSQGTRISDSLGAARHVTGPGKHAPRVWSSSGYDSDEQDLHAFPSRDVERDHFDTFDTSSRPYLRYSGSSTATHILDTPPRTPNPLDPIQVVVAPVAGVETMDALVDNMNGFHSEDLFASASIQRHEFSSKRRSNKNSKRSRFDSPLPPVPQLPAELPKPPPYRNRRHGSKIPRPVSSKASLGNSVYAGALGRTSEEPSPDPDPSPPTPPATPEAKSYSRSHTVIGTASIEPRKAAIPSISEIIRNHAPIHTARPRTAPSRVDHDTEELASRSSIDSVAEEVQRTIRRTLSDSPARQNDSPWSTKSVSPLPEPAFTLTRGSSICSSEASTPLPPVPFQPAPLTDKEAIATYLRSTRLTKLIKLPRPHQPSLQVSISDLGDPNGRPVVVFLGLGSVRYLMGLYDEMAEVLGLRLITIDR
jgi:hypothetical protein